MTHLVLFVIDHASRAIEIPCITTNPDSAFVAQIARNLTDSVDGFLHDERSLLLDRDTEFTAPFQRIPDSAGVVPVTTGFQAPDLNAVATRGSKTKRSPGGRQREVATSMSASDSADGWRTDPGLTSPS